VLEDHEASFNTILVSPLGNLFQIGDIDNIEEIEIDEHHTEYIVQDAGETQRKILFHDNDSNYSILINEEGTPNITTGVDVEYSKDEDWIEFARNEVGLIGQEVSYDDVDNDDDGDTLEEFLDDSSEEDD
jgi:hypothetical protein